MSLALRKPESLGHIRELHVYKTRAKLAARLLDEPEIRGASSFFGSAVAAWVVRKVLFANCDQVCFWLAAGGKRLTLRMQFRLPVGYGMLRGESLRLFRYAVVVLKRTEGGFKVITAYPDEGPALSDLVNRQVRLDGRVRTARARYAATLDEYARHVESYEAAVDMLAQDLRAIPSQEVYA